MHWIRTKLYGIRLLYITLIRDTGVLVPQIFCRALRELPKHARGHSGWEEEKEPGPGLSKDLMNAL